MKIEQNAEQYGFRIVVSVDTREALSHKLLSESELLQEMIKVLLDELGYNILYKLNEEKKWRNL